MRWFLALSLIILTNSCEMSSLNNPYTEETDGKTVLYSSFSERPRHLDPAKSYSANEYSLIAQIYEPPLQYHYLKRPYELVPLTTASLPEEIYYNVNNEILTGAYVDSDIAFTEYLIEIKPGIKFQPHPAFVKQNRELSVDSIKAIATLEDFTQLGTRELIADDYIYQIKRLANPKIQSPIAEIMKHYIVGFAQFAASTKTKAISAMRDIDMAGLQAVGRYQYKIRIKGKYPQFKFWLAMPFFAPMPWEADEFYQQAGLKEKNITLDWYPVGTGPYFLTENNPNRRMVLEKNPNFHEAFYPSQGEDIDIENGLLEDTGKRLPFIDKVIYTLEKETIPYWNKFLQGYYDASGISSDSFDQAVQFTGGGGIELTDEMKNNGIQLKTSVTASIYYFGFNMLDSVVGGSSERARKLRQAISIAIDYEEFIAIFTNGRGIAAQGIIPPGIFGFEEGKSGMNPYVYDWEDGDYQRKPIQEAEKLMADAGYPNGIDPKTGQALVLYFDTTAVSVDDRPRMNWFRKQFNKLGIKLVIRSTDYNRFQEKMKKGNAQMFVWGWNADYPDSENFFFLLYGANGKVKNGGENAANYNNPSFNQLFESMRNMDDGEQRMKIIQQMQEIIRKDAPWVFGFHPKNFSLFHGWYKNIKPNLIAKNGLKYTRIETNLRSQKREAWNQPTLWPLLVGVLLFFILLAPAVYVYQKKLKQTI